jgi:hypothetical protein
MTALLQLRLCCAGALQAPGCRWLPQDIKGGWRAAVLAPVTAGAHCLPLKCCRLVSSELHTSSLRAAFVSPVTAGAHCLTPEPSSMVYVLLGCVDAHGLCGTGGSFLLLCQLAAVSMTKTLLLKHYVMGLDTIACFGPGYAVQVPLTVSPSTASTWRKSSVLGRPHLGRHSWRDTQRSYRRPRPNCAGASTACQTTQEMSGCIPQRECLQL